ncbi:MAG: phenylalanine--tRNA ligase subunit beta, partial [Lachnospiraceae bacterium]|nr:phenylalanine--tRNA ligase subunit beta [Lachnospiraceae bacterium]
KRTFTPLPKFPEQKRDLCFVMDKQITCAQIEDSVKASCDRVTSITLFDIYEGEQLGSDKKSMAFSLVFTPADIELTDKDIDEAVEKLLADLNAKYRITLRA